MIDVLINSCGRIDVLEKAIGSFLLNVRTKQELRMILLEDKVADAARQSNGKIWVENHKAQFDTVVFSDKVLTYIFAFGEGLKYVTSEYFIHLEDDMEFLHPIRFDYYIKTMDADARLSSVCLKKNNHRFLNPSAGIGVIYNDFFSIGTGIFNTKRTKKIVGLSGTGECHESKVLSVSMRKLGYTAAVANDLSMEYDIYDMGKEKGYVKGRWK